MYIDLGDRVMKLYTLNICRPNDSSYVAWVRWRWTERERQTAHRIKIKHTSIESNAQKGEVERRTTKKKLYKIIELNFDRGEIVFTKWHIMFCRELE